MDLYSLGVILLELLTWKPPDEEMNEVFDVDLMRDSSENVKW